jgi:deazaflavin-dependent oxidoreductase (nitroreductase family)
MPEQYKRPDWFTKHVFNPLVAGLTRLGVSIAGSRVLEVPGRKSGQPRRTPVNLLTLEGERYLVAPRGNTQWARNLRASGSGRLLVGRRAEDFTAIELPDAEKSPILREYLRRWKWEAGQFFDGVTADSSEEEIQRIAATHPVFKIRPKST